MDNKTGLFRLSLLLQLGQIAKFFSSFDIILLKSVATSNIRIFLLRFTHIHYEISLFPESILSKRLRTKIVLLK